MSTIINPLLPFVHPQSADHPSSRLIQAYYGDLDAIARNTELAFAAGTTSITIPDPQFVGDSWAERAAEVACTGRPAVRIEFSFLEIECYSPTTLSVARQSLHVLYAIREVLPQCLDWQHEYLWAFCAGQQVLISSVFEIRNGHNARWSSMTVEYPNSQGGTMDPRWHHVQNRANPMDKCVAEQPSVNSRHPDRTPP
jgi:hypothetical protein